jgi:mannitol/fructose-specific phosphotransferase system IIA component (Ntr-type)
VLLRDLLTLERIHVPVLAKDKASVIHELVKLAANGTGALDDIFRAVMAREAALSTGIGYGVAIPHGKSPRIPELRLAAGASPQPVAFDALDGLPVRLFFLLIGPENASADHVHALSRISRLVRRESLRERLLAVRDAEEFYRTLCDAEGK